MKTNLPISKLQHFSAKTVLLAVAVLLSCTTQLFAGVKPACKAKTAHNKSKTHLQTAPTISYSSPKICNAGKIISSLTPTSSGVAAPGYGASAPFSTGIGDPFGVATDAAGNIYVAQVYASTVSRIPAGGGAAVNIGSGFSGPQDVAVDAAGNVYVADAGNNSIKKILVGGGSTITFASGFNDPTGVAVDAAGNVFVADYGNNEVKEIPAGSTVPVILASGFNGPYQLALDNSDNIYVSDYENNAVKEVPAGGGTPTVFASGISAPSGVAVDGSGNVYVVSHTNYTVQMFPAGGGSPVTISSSFDLPVGIAIDPSGNIFVGDTFNGAVDKIEPVGGYFISPQLPAGLNFNATTGVISGTPAKGSPATNYTITAYNSSGSGTATLSLTVNALTLSYASPQSYTDGTPIPALTPTNSGVALPGTNNNNGQFAISSGFNAPGGTAVDVGGNLYIADVNNNEVKEIPYGGGTPVVIGSGFSKPAGVAVDGAGYVYVADAGNNAVKRIPVGGGTPVVIGTGFSDPTGVAVDRSGNVYVADQGNRAIKKIVAADGTTITLSKAFNLPVAVAVNTAGTIYVADASADEILMISASGGQPNYIAPVSDPTGVAVDLSGNVYITSHGTNSLYMIVGGTIVISGSNNLLLISAGFASPVGVAADATGNIYVADQTANDLVKVVPSGGYYISPALPVGLNINSNTGAISGTPATVVLSENFSVTAYNSYGHNSASLYITATNPAAPSVSYASPQSYSLNVAINSLKPTQTSVQAPAYSSSAGTLASLSTPQGVAVDKTGNVYEVNAISAYVTEIPAAGGNNILLGSGFFEPTGVAVDAVGNIYVADYGNNAVKKIPAGNGTPVTLGSGFSGPTGVAVDAAGNIYVADFNNNAVKEIPVAGGAVVTLGSGFNHPFSVAVDPGGDVYVADALNSALKEIPAGSNTPVVLGSGYFVDPYGVATDAEGNVFVADRNGNQVAEIPFGSTQPVGIGSGFFNPYSVAAGSTGKIFVADYSNNAVKVIAPLGGYFISPQLPAGLSFSNTTGILSGTPTALSAATNYTVTAYNYDAAAQATLNVKVVSKDATLSALNLLTATLKPAFVPANLNYTATVSNSTDDISVQPTLNFPGASLTVNGYNVPSGSVSDGIALNVGPNTISIVVTAEDGVTKKTYTIVVTRISNIATLSNIAVSKGSLSPAFASGTNTYYDMVTNGTTSLTLTPTASDPTATITVNGTAVKSGVASGAITLAVGSNTITTVVTAQDGTTTDTYTVNVTRPTTNAKLSALALITATLSPAFNANTTSYTATVPYTVSDISVQATTASNVATLTIDGYNAPSGSVSDGIELAVGTNTIPVVVTAQDGVTTDTYTITVTRSAPVVTLSALKLVTGTLSPAFSPNTASYTSTVSNATSDISVQPTLTDPNASLTVQGYSLPSGAVSDGIALNYGKNTITIVVTGIDGVTTKTYTILVTRISNIATLSNMVLSRGTLSPAFATATNSYTDIVTNSTASTTLTPTASDPGATITVNGTAVKSGAASGAIALSVGSNLITVVVTAQDGVTTDTYTVNVIRPSTNAKLASLTISNGSLTPVFNTNTTSYTVDETNDVSSVNVTPTAAVNGSTITVDGDNSPSGTVSDGINLNVGSNTITIVVTAQDGVTTDTYTITATRNVAGMNNRYDPLSVAAPSNDPQLAEDGLVVHPGVTPNGDGIDDYLRIDNISSYPDNKLSIMNRNGQLVYEANSYDNATRVFDGHSNKNGQMQLPGTYFYQLDYTVNGIVKHKTGYLVLKY